MALVPCRECGKQISTEAIGCPSCGAKPGPDKLTRIGQRVLAGVATTVVLITVIQCSSLHSSLPTPTPLAAAPPPIESAAAQAAKALETKRFDLAYDVTTAIRKSSRDPSSTTFESVGVNSDATVVCVQYRSRNGFGGMNREAAVYVGGAIKSASKALIGKHCQGLKDYLSAAN
jgi:hypothetical protein